MSSVTLPRLDIPITGRAAISDEWYRWARDVTVRIGGVSAPSPGDLLQIPPTYPVEPAETVDPLLQDQNPPQALQEDRPEEYRPPVLPVEDRPEELRPPAQLPAQEAVEWLPPTLVLSAEDRIVSGDYAPSGFVPAQESVEWLAPALQASAERVEWLENRVSQLQAVIEDLALQVAGIKQGTVI